VTSDEIFAELSGAVGREGPRLALERDPLGRVVAGDAARTWRAVFSPGPLPLRVAYEGAVPRGDGRRPAGFWAAVDRLTASAGGLSARDTARLRGLKDRLGDRGGDGP